MLFGGFLGPLVALSPEDVILRLRVNNGKMKSLLVN